MVKLQNQLLDLTKRKNIGEMSYREIGELVGEKHPQVIKYHLNQLAKKGLLIFDKKNKIIEQAQTSSESLFFPIPIIATENINNEKYEVSDYKGMLKISKSILDNIKIRPLYALKAENNSMNRANLNNRNIEYGDYVIYSTQKSKLTNGSCALYIIDGVPMIRKALIEEETGLVALVTESTHNLPPIYLHLSDLSEKILKGQIIDVVKQSVG